jgi:small subunit ribosomal protein S15
MLNPKSKQKLIAKFRIHASDTGSPEVQIAILTEEIKELTRHLKEHRHDFSSRRGLLKKVAERKKLLRYLYRESVERFEKLVEQLKLKISRAFLRREEALKELSEDEAKAEEEIAE